ncbi:MAG: endonuclease/exonuclease/phosphatase family protein [Bacteroidales bacterium]|nr:endonuclease/exonuclease/phosphatase family protein [Bacteroidales bacterium]
MKSFLIFPLISLMFSFAVDLMMEEEADRIIIKVGSYNICTPSSRAKQIKSGTIASDRYWSNCAGSVAAMVNSIDCDIIAFQEVGDSTWCVKGKCDIRSLVADGRSKNDRYVWVLYPNTAKGTIAYDNAIGFKKNRFSLVDDGIFWLGGVFDAPKYAEDAPKETARPVVWVKLKDKRTKKVFWFFNAHLTLQGKGITDGRNLYTAKRLMEYVTELVPEGMPSVIAGDFNAGYDTESIGEIISAGYEDAYLALKGLSMLTENVLSGGTQPKKDETGSGSWIPDHIFYRNGFVPLSFDIDRRKFPALNGVMHDPSDHFPIVAELMLE